MVLLRVSASFIACVFLIWFTLSVSARPVLADDQTPERGTAAEARALVERAVAHIRTVGVSQSFQDFSDPDGGFQDKDLYIFVQDYNCTFLMHGLNPGLVGRNIWDLQNPNGRFACREIVEKTKEQGAAWTDYVFQDPISGQLAEKTTYSFGMADFVVSSGAYK